MKKLIFVWVATLALASIAFCQEGVLADSGSIAPSQGSPSADTNRAVTTLPDSAITDTAVVTKEQPKPPADTETVILQPPSAPTDTNAAPVQPADTGRAAPQEKIVPTEPGPASPSQSLPEKTATNKEEGEAPKEKPANRFGMGIVFNDEAPLAIRAWFNPKVGVDVGVGLRARRVDDLTDTIQPPQHRTTLLDLSFDLGIPIRAIRKEKVDFILRPGFALRTRPGFVIEVSDTAVRSIETAIDLEVNGSVGFEYYPIEKASFSLQAGVAVVVERTGGDISNNILHVQSFPSEKGINFSFRYYLF